MDKNIKIFAVAIVILASSYAAYFQITKPRTVEDCILQNIKDASNSAAVSVVTVQCRKKFNQDVGYIPESELFK